MNTISRTLVALLAAAALLTTGCRKSQLSSDFFLHALVNETVFYRPGAQAYDDSGTVVFITGSITDPSYPYIELKIRDSNLTKGSYDIGAGLPGEAYYHVAPGVTSVAIAGSITITHIPEDDFWGFRGTFNFTCSDGTAVSQGTFASAPWFYKL